MSTPPVRTPPMNDETGAGVLVARVEYVKEGAAKRFVVVDAAMNDLIRPTLYEAYHAILPVVAAPGGQPTVVADVVGGVCETGDYLARDREVPALAEGDLVAFMTAGAYGAVQSSTYNTRPLAAEVMVRGKAWATVRPRQEVEALIAAERLPPWLASG